MLYQTLQQQHLESQVSGISLAINRSAINTPASPADGTGMPHECWLETAELLDACYNEVVVVLMRPQAVLIALH